jgi:hypothetical protein
MKGTTGWISSNNNVTYRYGVDIKKQTTPVSYT